MRTCYPTLGTVLGLCDAGTNCKAVVTQCQRSGQQRSYEGMDGIHTLG